jgi:hypothetical protein
MGEPSVVEKLSPPQAAASATHAANNDAQSR